MPNRKIVGLVWALLWAHSARAEINYVAQMGANQGLIAGGIAGGYGVLDWATTIGMTPSMYNDELIAQLNGKLNVRLVNEEAYRLLTGVSVFINPSKRTFFYLPEKYPDGYYPPNAYFFALQLTVAASNGVFVEASILDYFIEVLASNPRGSVYNGEMISLGIGTLL